MTPFIRKTIPLQFFSSTIVREIYHAMVSMKSLLAVTRKGAANLTPEDIATNFNLKKPSEDLVQSVRANANTAAEAAAIIFIHSTCENAVFELIKLLVRYDPEPWLPSILRKQVRFEEALSSTPDAIRNRLLADYLATLERESFPKKIDQLLKAIQPKVTSCIIAGFTFDRDEFVAIDELRHRLTHEPSFSTPITDAVGKLTFLVNTLNWLVALAELKYPGTETPSQSTVA
jgi:hypothetical protein